MEKVNTPIGELIEQLKNGIKSLDEFPDMVFKRGYEKCTETIILALERVLDKEKEAIEESFRDGGSNTLNPVLKGFSNNAEHYYSTKYKQ